jgi:hypothetical protein
MRMLSLHRYRTYHLESLDDPFRRAHRGVGAPNLVACARTTRRCRLTVLKHLAHQTRGVSNIWLRPMASGRVRWRLGADGHQLVVNEVAVRRGHEVEVARV